MDFGDDLWSPEILLGWTSHSRVCFMSLSRNGVANCGKSSYSMIWVWVKSLGTPKLWMANTKLDFHICGPLNGLPFWPTSIFPMIHCHMSRFFNQGWAMCLSHVLWPRVPWDRAWLCTAVLQFALAKINPLRTLTDLNLYTSKKR